MEVRFLDDKLDRLETDTSYAAGFSRAIVTVFRKRMQFIRAATDERDLREMKSLHFEKLAGARKHQHSIRLNDQYRLIIEITSHSKRKVLNIISIEDYH
ncbi:MAG: type II toxin-antitoxin system RelE/ParE family toxin [Chloroflexi bacterium]|nr:type II toxin-antitoxin system RelE/ParE family toxin [Chloroflexota bacterium]